MLTKKRKIAARVYAGRAIEAFWQRWLDGQLGGFHAEVYMLLLLRAKEALRMGGDGDVQLTVAEISRQCQIDWRTAKADLNEMERQGLIQTMRSGYTQRIRLTGLNADDVCRGAGGRHKSVEKCNDYLCKNAEISVGKSRDYLCKNAEKDAAHKEKEEKTKESAPTPPAKKEKNKERRKGCCGFTTATHTAGEGSKKENQRAVAQGQQVARASMEQSHFGDVNEMVVNRQQGARASMEERMQAFAESIRPYVGKYGPDMCNAFYQYWTEPNRTGTKMRWELERTWSIGGRLAKWKTYEAQFESKARKAAPVNTSAYVDSALQSMSERELQRLRQEAEVVPRWAYNLLKKHRQLSDNCTATYAMGFVRQLAVTGRLETTERELLARWQTKRQRALESLEKYRETAQNGTFEK